MSEPNDSQEQEAGTCCEPGCCCGTSGSGSRGRWIAGIVILLVAGVLVVRAMTKGGGTQAAPASTGFAALPARNEQPAPDAGAVPATKETPATSNTVEVKEIAALSELNEVAADAVGVFVFLPGKTETGAKVPTAQLEGAIRTMEPQLNGGKIGLFTLKIGSRDYEQISAQMTTPGVLAMAKGGGMSAVSGEITEPKLIQGFVAASSAGGCGPASAGCGPSGCN